MGQTAATACGGLLAAEAPDLELAALSSYDYGKIVGLLHRHIDVIGLQRIITIEWQLFPGLGFEPESPTLHSTLGTDPAFFAELVGYVYRSEDATDEAGDEHLDQSRLAIARRAYDVLRSWHKCPGTGPDGRVDRGALWKWVVSARAYLHERHRTAFDDGEIGRVLAHAAPDADGTFPPIAVCDLVEEIGSERLDEGLEIEIWNKRGVTSRGAYEGGDQERDLSATYRKAATQAAAWPRTRRMLRRLADGFDREARRLDEDAEGRRRGLDQ